MGVNRMIPCKKAISISVTLAYMFAAIFAGGQRARAQAAPTPGKLVWSDEFGQQASRWDWAYNQGSGYKRLVRLQDAPTALECGITAASESASYSDCSLHEKTASYTTGIFEARLRTSDDNGIAQPGKGSRGWGFWDGGGDAAWFWSASSESDPPLVGLRAQVTRGNRIIFNQALPNVDMRQWHTYRVELLADSASFYVDGALVASTNERPNKPQRAELWVDNARFRLTSTGYIKDFLDVNQDEKMYTDWARYYELTSAFVINRSFEVDKNSNSFPDNWNASNLGANDKRIASSAADGAYIFQFTPSGSTTAFKGLNQSLNQSGRLNDAWRVSLWTRTAASSPAGTLRVRLKFISASGAALFATKTLTKSTQGGYQTFTLVAPQDYARVTVYLESSITQGNVYLDNVSLARP